MTLRMLIESAGEHPLVLLALFVAPPAAAWVAGRLHGRGESSVRWDGGRSNIGSPWRQGYAVLVYLTCVPGVVAAVLVAYTLFFTGENLLDVDLLVFFLPLASMVATLVLIGRNVDFDDIPGFDRLFGLMVMIAVSFTIALVIQKTRILVFVGASIAHLLVFAAVAFLLLKWASHRLLGHRPDHRT